MIIVPYSNVIGKLFASLLAIFLDSFLAGLAQVPVLALLVAVSIAVEDEVVSIEFGDRMLYCFIVII